MIKKNLNRLKLFLKYRYARKKIKILKSLNDDNKKNREQLLATQIVKIISSNSNSKILIAPISNKYYIINNDIFIIVESNMISIINSVYHYDIYMTQAMTSSIIKFLNRIIERRIFKTEKEIKSKVEKSLEHILIDLPFKIKK